jgi:GAF domain-containing protein/HAMP domain-containing protein
MRAPSEKRDGGGRGPLNASGGGTSAAGASIVRSRLFIKYVVVFVAVVGLALIANGAFDVYFSYAPLHAALERTALVLLGALALAFAAGLFLARRMVVPIQALRAGAARLGSGDLGQRIAIKTGDELEALADQFNDMAGRLQESYANLEQKVEARTRELSESLEQQTATSEVLQVISRSRGDLLPVFDAILDKAVRICSANSASLFLYEDGVLNRAARYGTATDAVMPATPSAASGTVRSITTKQIVHIPDYLTDRAYLEGDTYVVAAAERLGLRASLHVPMLKENDAVGVITIWRTEARAFTEKQIELIAGFAAQAVIAIENVRLLNELHESLQQQTGTADVLKAISRSTFNLPTVLSALVESAARLCRADMAQILLPSRVANSFYSAASYGHTPEYNEYVRTLTFPPGREGVVGRVLLEHKPVQIADVLAGPDYRLPEVQRLGGFRTHLGLPLLREGNPIGILIVSRATVQPFDDKHIALLTTFADQAVVAIENTRLFEAEQQRTQELSESLEQQTATSDVLRVISSSQGDLQPVFNVILENATRICEAKYGNLYLFSNDAFQLVATTATFALDRLRDPPVQAAPGTGLGRMLQARAAVQITDVLTDQEYPLDHPLRRTAEREGIRTLLCVPMIKEDELIGALGIFRQEVRPFAEKQVQLVGNFAAQAVIAIENTRLLTELRESLEQQTATADVLRVISNSPGNLKPAFGAMLENAARICGANFGNIYRWENDALHLVASHNVPPAYAKIRGGAPFRPPPESPTARMIETKSVTQVADLAAEQAYAARDPAFVEGVEIGGIRTLLSVPMLKEDKLVGAFTLYRQEVRPFTDKQVALVLNFANQAVIAIENARLLSELRESLAQQTATADVLKVISRSTFDLHVVLDTLTKSATQLCAADLGLIFEQDGDVLRLVANLGISREAERYWLEHPVPVGRGSATARALLEGRAIRIPDVLADPEYRSTRAQELAGHRSTLTVPLLRDGTTIGVFALARREPNPFTDKQAELVTIFADQAVIAIENARLLTELRQRTDDLTESLEQQTATSEVLQVISSSPGDFEPVFAALLEKAVRLCGAKFGNLHLREGDAFRTVAMHNAPAHYAEARLHGLVYPGPHTALAEVVRTKRAKQVEDVKAGPAYRARDPLVVSAVELGGVRTMLVVPMLKDDELVGSINIYRLEVKPFNQKQIDIVSNFAAQAVIAVENARLLTELRQRTDDLTESLEQQTATSEILASISGSLTDPRPVFNAIVHNLLRLFGARFATVQLLHDGTIEMPAADGEVSVDKIMQHYPRPLDGTTVGGQAMLAKQVVQYAPVLDNPVVPVAAQQIARDYRYNSIIAAPMIRQDNVIGAIVCGNPEPRVFDEKETALIKSFADQAVIAIENARLLTELRESLQRQTATADVLKVISRSAFDLRTVLETLLQSAVRLCEADQGTITQRKGDTFYRSVSQGFPAAFAEYVKDRPVELARDTGTGRALLESKVVHIPDVQADPDYGWKEAQRLGGFRTMLGVPMLREGVPIGVLTLTRSVVRPFTDKQIELVATFADQAAIAIENVRLFESVEARTRELAKSLEDLRTAQDRLVQTEKLASLGQLTAGIAHEIKNPLNFVNNFSSVSVELIDELQEALRTIAVDDKTRADVTEVSDMLRDNLEKVVQHGKRADSIVKNMLLHSRQGSGEHQPVDINALVEESLNLAYHGARAEKQGFNITLQRSLDPTAGQVDLFPQEITRVLLNLISNGFYATTKRKAESRGGDYEPTLLASTKSLGDSVEIRIRDNGAGIPPEVRDKMFNPFFTTKPAGEGTGLGLSLSHDIIVKQHAGTIEVDTRPGEFTEFRIVLPRAAAAVARSGGNA